VVSSPKLLAASTILSALTPSRETAQRSRTSSSRTSSPSQFKIMVSEAAPHSVTSICSTVGVRTVLWPAGATGVVTIRRCS
jgi:hypothetical protein